VGEQIAGPVGEGEGGRRQRELKILSVSESTFNSVESLLKQHGVSFEVLRHQPVFTSEEAAAGRGVALSTGAKALICKVDNRFVMFVIPADRKLDSKRVRQALGIWALRFATPDELRELTGLTPGAVPPFGSLFGVPFARNHHHAH
jgi:Ala-tRNA(Pro) deacylase